MPEVSIIIPFYQKHATLRRCLDSIRFRHMEAEILVVDDGSTPPLVKEDFGESDFRLIRQENAGPGSARNHGAAEANGRYLLFLDADDFLDPDFETHMLAGIRAESEVIVGGFRYLKKAEDHFPFFQEEPNQRPALLPESLDYRHFRMACDFFAAGTCLIRKDVFLRTKGFYDRDKAVFGEDIYLWFQVLLLCQTIQRIPKVVVMVDDAHSQLGISRKKGRPVSVLARCPAGDFMAGSKTKSPIFVRTFLFEYRKEAALSLIHEGRYREFFGLALDFPRLLSSYSVCSYLIKRFLVNGAR